MLRRAFLIIAIVIALAAQTARARDLLRQEKDGGWQGGAIEMECRHGNITYRVAIRGGTASVRMGRNEATALEVTYTPYGFVMTAGTRDEGFTYVASFAKRTLGIQKYGPGFEISRMVYAGCSQPTLG